MTNLTKGGIALIPADVSAIKVAIAIDQVDNIPDVNKPVSTAQAAAIGTKADAAATTAALLLKAPLANPAFTGTPTGITKAHVGLANVDNTPDVNKPVSTLQAAAISVAANAAVGSSLQKAANLSDLVDPTAARASLGLGSAAILAATAFDSAGAAAAAQAAAIAATTTSFVTLAALNTAIGSGALAAAAASQKITLSTEPVGVVRIWNGINANQVLIRPGLVRTLASNLNQVYTTSGAPTSGSSFWSTAISGDEAVDYTNNVYYSRGASAWSVVSGIYPTTLTSAQAATVAQMVSEYGASYTWAARPNAASTAGKVIPISDIGNSPAGTLMKSDGVYYRPLGGHVHFGLQSASPFYPLTQNTGAAAFNFTLPVSPTIPADFLIPGQSQIEVEVWVYKSGANGTAALNVYLGLNNSTSDFRIVQGNFASADGSALAPRPLVSVGNAIRLSSTTFLTVGSISAQTGASTDSSVGMFNSATPTYLTIGVTGANPADTFRLVAYRLTVKQ